MKPLKKYGKKPRLKRALRGKPKVAKRLIKAMAEYQRP